MAEQNKPMGSLVQRAMLSLSNLLRPKAYQGAFESARYSIHRTRVDAPQPDDFRRELNEAARRELVRLSRWLEKNSGFYNQMIKDNAIYTVGDGIMLQALGGDADWQAEVEAEWESEMESPEVTGRFSLHECLYIIQETLFRDGEIFVILTKVKGKPKFQLIETHRVCNPVAISNDIHINDGIEYDSYGKPVCYYVQQSDGNFKKIPATAMLHVYNPRHASAGRSYPPHQHAINNLRDELDLLAMEKVAAKDNSRVSRILQTPDPTPDIGDMGIGVPTSQNPVPTNPDAISRAIGGVTAVLAPGEKLVEYTPTRPSQAFTGFIEHLRRDSAMGGLPFEFISNPQKIGGTPARLVVAKTARFISHNQNVLVNRFLKKWYRFWIGVKIDRKEIRPAKNFWLSDWQTPKPVTVDNGRESANVRADLLAGVRTPQDVFQEQGVSFHRQMIQKAKAIVYRDKVAKEFNIDPERLMSLKTQATLQTETQLQVAEIQGTAAGKQVVINMADESANPDALANIDPAMEEPEETETAATPMEELYTSVNVLPKQNQGLDRSREQPPIEYPR